MHGGIGPVFGRGRTGAQPACLLLLTNLSEQKDKRKTKRKERKEEKKRKDDRQAGKKKKKKKTKDMHARAFVRLGEKLPAASCLPTILHYYIKPPLPSPLNIHSMAWGGLAASMPPRKRKAPPPSCHIHPFSFVQQKQLVHSHYGSACIPSSFLVGAWEACTPSQHSC